MSNILKCNACNIVIDELLSYIQNKVSVIDEETLVRLCVSSFSGDEIKKSKSLLFDSIPTNKRKIVRKNKGKEERDLADMVNLFKSTEPDVIPVFVARQLEKLPPILFNHLDCTKLLKDILRAQNDIEEIKATYASHKELQKLKTEISQLKTEILPPSPVPKVNLNSKQSGWMTDSVPLPDLSSLNESYNSAEESLSPENVIQIQREIVTKQSELVSSSPCKQVSTAAPPPAAEEASVALASPVAASSNAASGSIDNMTRVSLAAERRCVSETEHTLSLYAPLAPPTPRTMAAATAAAPRVRRVLTNEHSSSTSQLEHSNSKNNHGVTIPMKVPIKGKPKKVLNEIHHDTQGDVNSEGWHMVSRRKKMKYRYLGKTGVACDEACNFKAADRKIPIFITNVHNDTPENDIVKYIHKKTQESVLLQKVQTKQRGHMAFKFFVSEKKLPMYLDEKLWPQGIIFRRFVSFKHKNMNGVFSVDGTNRNNNG